MEIVFEEPMPFKRERDEFIESLQRLISHYLDVEFVPEEDIKECIYNALERFVEAVDLRDPLGKVLPSLWDWKLKRFVIRIPEQSKYGKMIVSSEFEKKGDRVYLNAFVLEDDPYSLQFEWVVPKEIFKRLVDDRFFEMVEVEKGWEEYVALRTNCKKLLVDKLYWRGIE